MLAGPIVDSLDYHWLFWIPLIVVSLAAVAAALRHSGVPVRRRGPISVLGGLLLTGWLVCLLLAVSEGSTWGWGSGKTLGLIADRDRDRGHLVLVGIALEGTADRHADDAAARGLDDQPRGAALRCRHVCGVRFLPGFVQATVRSWATASMPRSPSPASSCFRSIVVDVHLRHAQPAARPSASAPKLMVLVGRRTSARSATRMLAFAHDEKWEVFVASGHRGCRARARVRRDVEPDRRRGAAGADRRRQRHERQHPDPRWLDRFRRHGDDRHRGSLRQACPRSPATRMAYAVLAGFGVLATLSVPADPRQTPGSAAIHVDMAHAELALVAGGTLVRRRVRMSPASQLGRHSVRGHRPAAAPGRGA